MECEPSSIYEESSWVQETLDDESKGHPNVYICVSYQLINAIHTLSKLWA